MPCLGCSFHREFIHFFFNIQAQITDEERAAFKQIFDCYDVNKDGHITSKEVNTVLKKLGMNPTEEEVKEFIKTCDTDKNGTIEFSEFCSYLVGMRRTVRKIMGL